MKSRSILILVGPSAVGKTTVANELVRSYGYFSFIRSLTTRPPRGDGNDDEYLYTTREGFLREIECGGVLEHTEYDGTLYGTPRSEIESNILIYIGIALFSLATLFQIITLPVELNASKRAMQTIRGQALLSDSEAKGARKVLTAAAMTYIAAVIMSVAQLLRLLLIVRRND